MSTFRKKNGLLGRSPSPIGKNTKRLSSNHLSSTSQNYTNELQKANEKNQNLLDSLINEKVFEPTDEGPNITELKEKLRSQNISQRPITADGLPQQQNEKDRIQSQPLNQEPTQQDNQGLGFSGQRTHQTQNNKTGNSKFDPLGQSQLASSRINRSVDDPSNHKFTFNINPPTMSSDPNLNGQSNQPGQNPRNSRHDFESEPHRSQARFEEEPHPQQQGSRSNNFYKNNLDKVLTIVALKKIIHVTSGQNHDLHNRNKRLESEKTAQQSQIEALQRRIQDLEIEVAMKGSKLEKVNIEEFKQKLEEVSDTTNDENQDKFLTEIMQKNQSNLSKTIENTQALKKINAEVQRLKEILSQATFD